IPGQDHRQRFARVQPRLSPPSRRPASAGAGPRSGFARRVEGDRRAVSGLGRGARRPLRVLLHDGPAAGAQTAAADDRARRVRRPRTAPARAALAVPGQLTRWYLTMPCTYEYPRPSLTVDIVLVTRESRPRVLFIRRKADPFKGAWAIPGGFVDEGEP